MNRRLFITSTLAFVAAPMIVVSETVSFSYKPGLLSERLSAGETVFLDFKASWCSTCRVQDRVIKSLKAENTEYEKNITFIDVDWDQFGDSELVKRFNIPRRSTLLVLQNNDELGRIVAGTKRKQIKALLEVALLAAKK